MQHSASLWLRFRVFPGLLQLGDSPAMQAAMQAAWATAVKSALDAEQPLPGRLDAVSLLTVAPWSHVQAHGYTVYVIATSNGQVHTGLLASDSATSVTLRSAAEPSAAPGSAAVVEAVTLRKEIEEMRALSNSLMPDGMEKELTPQDFADRSFAHCPNRVDRRDR